MTQPVASPARRPRRKDKLANAIAQSVLADIKQRGLTAGDKLPNEAAMLEQYDVGRGTLREAMRVLETCGLISLKPGPHGGPVVQSAHPEDFGRVASLFFQVAGVTYREVVEARLVLEPMAARLAAERHHRSAEADALLQLATGEAPKGDEHAYLNQTADFHASVVALSGNGLLTLVCQSLAEIYRDRVAGVLFPKSRQKDVYNVHADVAQAIVDGDGDRAYDLMAEHMGEYAKYVEKRHPSLLDEDVVWRTRG